MEETFESANMATYPSVYAVEDEYLVCVLVKTECTMWVEVDGKNYYDHSNGILRSAKFVHMARVPVEALDAAGRYTVHLRKLNERKPYYTDYGDEEVAEFTFRAPALKDRYNFVNVADAHSLWEEPVRSGSFFGDDLDFLLMNGDIPNHSGDIEYFKSIYMISGGITKGRVPCVFSRGNHDLRGIYAEQLADYTPVTRAGASYFTFHFGPVWGIVVDCGEDKRDDQVEYGRTICCEAFRAEEEEYIDRTIAAREYEKYPVRLIVSHVPFEFRLPPPFDIEQERYARWCEKCKAFKSTLMATGHLHACWTELPGGEHDTYGQPCPVVCSSHVKTGEGDRWHVSGALTLEGDTLTVRYPDSNGAEYKPADIIQLATP